MHVLPNFSPSFVAVQLYSFPPLLPVVTVLLALAQLKPIREAIHIRNSSGPGLMKGDRDLEVSYMWVTLFV